LKGVIEAFVFSRYKNNDNLKVRDDNFPNSGKKSKNIIKDT